MTHTTDTNGPRFVVYKSHTVLACHISASVVGIQHIYQGLNMSEESVMLKSTRRDSRLDTNDTLQNQLALFVSLKLVS